MKNVILFTIDTLRKDIFGCYGSKDGLTPFFDSLADKCTIFNKAQSAGPYTQAAFPGILASAYYLEYGKTPKPQLSPRCTLISEALKRAGIYTAGFHSNPYLSGFFGWNRGWNKFYDSMMDDVDDINPYIKGCTINDKVEKWLADYVKNQDYKPFFLWTHYMDVHEPYVPDRKYIEKVDPAISNLSKEEMFALFKDVVLKRDISDVKKVELARKLYKAHVVEVDEYARSFFGILGKYNVLKDSIVIITSDHGEEFEDHEGMSHDGKMYSELINVPFMVYDPGSDGKVLVDETISTIDISPTILKLYGIEAEPKFKGSSIFPIDEYVDSGCYGEAIGKLEHKVQKTDKPVYYFMKDDVKVIYREEDDRWELYDIVDDPQEKKNIIGDSSLASGMKDKLNEFIQRNKIN